MKIESKAIGFDKYGDVDVLEERQIQLDLNSTNNVLVKIERVGVNPVEAFIRSGNMSRPGQQPAGFQVLGGEVQGEIEKMYQPISGFKVGDKVIVKTGGGGDADYLTTNASTLFKIPENMPLDFAAGFSSAATTAYWGLHGGFYHVQEGDTLAIVGASGGVGSMLVQLAKPLNVKIIAVASEKNREFLLGLGADVFIDYKDAKQVSEYADSADFVLDASLFNAGEKVGIELTKEGGTYLGMTMLPQNVTKKINLAFLQRTPQTNEIAMPKLFDFYEEHGLDLPIGYVLPLTLEGVKEAHQRVSGDRNVSGKIILSK